MYIHSELNTFHDKKKNVESKTRSLQPQLVGQG